MAVYKGVNIQSGLQGGSRVYSCFGNSKVKTDVEFSSRHLFTENSTSGF